jgi:hypothetical protein
VLTLFQALLRTLLRCGKLNHLILPLSTLNLDMLKALVSTSYASFFIPWFGNKMLLL